MKKKLLFFLFLVTFSALSKGQNCYQVIGDIQGMNLDISSLEEISCQLKDSLPSEFSSDFKVLYYGFYLHNKVMQGGSENFLNSAKTLAEASSPYYILLSNQISWNGEVKYFIDIKPPQNWLPYCFDQLIVEAFENSVKNKFQSLTGKYNSSFERVQLEREVLKYVATKFGKYKSCCIPNTNLRSSNQCSDCISAYDVLNELESLGFEAYFAGEVTNSLPNEDQNCLCSEALPALKDNNGSGNRSTSVIDYANLTITVDNKQYNFGQELTAWVAGGNIAIVTKNKNYCVTSLFSNQLGTYNGATNAAWVHIWENPKNDDEDIVFIKTKFGSSSSNPPSESPDINIGADIPPPYKYKILHRSFAPWDRFGHLPILPGLHIAKNSFHGDNRGFSLDKYSLVGGTTARIHQIMEIELGKRKIPINGNTKFSSITKGYENFKQKKPVRYVPHPYKEELDRWEYGPNEEKEDFCKPSGFENFRVLKNITYTYMFFEGIDPLIKFPMIAPDLEWYLELGWYYKKNNQSINISGRVIGKSFPAYEALVEDECGNKAFIYTYTAPCESELAAELMNPIPDHNKGFDIAFKVDAKGCFTGDVTTIYDGVTSNTSLTAWNTLNLNKKAAKDCLTIPCQGAYPNDGSDKRNQFNCGN